MDWRDEVESIVKTKYPKVLDIDLRSEFYGNQAYVWVDRDEYDKYGKIELIQTDKYEFDLLTAKVDDELVMMVFQIYDRIDETGSRASFLS